MAHAVLLVDDERFARTVYSDYLRAAGYDVEVADGSEAALAILPQRRFDVLLTDVILPGSKDGLELLDFAKQLDPNIGVIVITALDRVDPAVRAMKAGASDYLVKPVTPDTLQVAVQRCLATRALLAENQALRAHLKLFETGQRLASTLDRDRFVPMALSAIASECGSPAAALLERTADGVFVPSGAHGMEYAQAADLLGMCAARARDARRLRPGGEADRARPGPSGHAAPARRHASRSSTRARSSEPWWSSGTRSCRRWPPRAPPSSAGTSGSRSTTSAG